MIRRFEFYLSENLAKKESVDKEALEFLEKFLPKIKKEFDSNKNQ